MKTAILKVNAKYQITIPKSVREQLKVKTGDRLLVDIQDGMIILIPEPKRKGSPLAVDGIKLNLSRYEILQSIEEGRRAL